MQDFTALVVPMLVKMGWFLAYLIAVGVVARRTQIESWVDAHPKAALVLRLLRSVGPDPLLAIKALKGFLAAKANVKDDPQ